MFGKACFDWTVLQPCAWCPSLLPMADVALPPDLLPVCVEEPSCDIQRDWPFGMQMPSLGFDSAHSHTLTAHLTMYACGVIHF